jgi:hypothetical protein
VWVKTSIEILIASPALLIIDLGMAFVVGWIVGLSLIDHWLVIGSSWRAI